MRHQLSHRRQEIEFEKSIANVPSHILTDISYNQMIIDLVFDTKNISYKIFLS